MAQRDFSAIADAFRRRFPDQEPPMEGGMEQSPPSREGLATELAMPDTQSAPAPTQTKPQEMNQIGQEKGEAQKIVEILGNRLKKLS